ncbi:MAG: hypothetical protein LBS74_08845 [Oscillospiraceae bacterium]|nr:hypothetical protein [Oscillospiraceae bacterium]
MGVGYIKVMFQAGLAAGFAVKNRNSSRALVDPPCKLLVPFFKLQHRNRVRSLDVNQKLLVKGQLVVAGGRTQKAHPLLGVGGLIRLMLIHRRD